MLEKINNPLDIKKLNNKELEELAKEIREFLIKNISSTGGHLSSNLGTVELTIALLKEFDFNKDKIVFDVGHQCYTYKILTGRKDKMHILRKKSGISGFPKTNESKYDFFNTGHASNSISASLGMARARDLNKDNYNVITVIGDGSLTGGMSFEALNDLGFKKTKMIIVLNDNGMAISNNVGSLSNCLNSIRLTPFYNKLKRKTHYRLDKIKSKKLTGIIRKLKNGIKSLILPSMYFENLGIRYIGPIDGHDIKKLTKTLEKVKEISEPVVVHIKTIKGKGYELAEKYPDIYHGVGKFSVEEGKKISQNDDYSSVFGKKIVKLAKKNKKIVAITAAMQDGTGLSEFATIYKDRFFDVGICEEHALTLAAGMAISGFKPFVAIYSSFLQRGFDQLIEDICMQNLPVTIMTDRSGIVGEDGETHHGIFDTSFLSLIPNITIMEPKCTSDLEKMIDFSINYDKPLVIKYPKGKNEYPFKPIKNINIGKWEIVSNGEKIAIISYGRMVSLAMKIKEKLKQNIMVINALFIKPIDDKVIKKLLKENYQIFVLEESVPNGSLGSIIRLKYDGINVISLKDKYIEQGTIQELLDEEFNVEKIVKMIKSKL